MSRSLTEEFQVDGKVFDTPGRRWTARIRNQPEPGSAESPYPDMVLYDLEFRHTDGVEQDVRRLRLWTSRAELLRGTGYRELLLESVTGWLSTSHATSGELWCLGDGSPASPSL